MGFISNAIDSVLGQSPATDFASVGDAPTFEISQLTGDLPKKVVLMGRALPYRPLNLKTKQRIEITWLPGSSKATTTVLGPSEEPTNITGYWKDKFVMPFATPADQPGGVEGLVNSLASLAGADGPFATQGGSAAAPIITVSGIPMPNVREAANKIDAIVREGQEVRVVWGNDVRIGILEEFDKQWHNVHDLEWTMKFTWTARDEPDVPVKIPFDQTPAAANSLGKILGDLLAAAQDPKFSLVPQFVQDMNADLKAISNLVDGITNLAEAMVTAVLSPINTIQQGIALAAGLAGACDDFANFLQASSPVSLNNGVSAPANLTQDRTSTGFVGGGAASSAASASQVGQTLVGNAVRGLTAVGFTVTPPTPTETAAASAQQIAALKFGTVPAIDTRTFAETHQAQQFIRTLLRFTSQMRREAVEFRSTFSDAARTQLKAVYTARDGDDLRKISRKFYNTMEHWQDLLVFNQFTSSIVTRGTVVLIPKDPGAGQ